VLTLNKLRDWVAFETLSILVSLVAIAVCGRGAYLLLTTLPFGDPLLSFGQAILGTLIGLHGCGYIIAIVFVIQLAMEINPELTYCRVSEKSRK
jgi:hypothetical protein